MKPSNGSPPMRLFSAVAALCFSPWIWLTPKAKRFKALVLISVAGVGFVAFSIADQPIGVALLLGIAAMLEAMRRRWQREDGDLPREWIAPIRER